MGAEVSARFPGTRDDGVHPGRVVDSMGFFHHNMLSRHGPDCTLGSDCLRAARPWQMEDALPLGICGVDASRFFERSATKSSAPPSGPLGTVRKATDAGIREVAG